MSKLVEKSLRHTDKALHLKNKKMRVNNNLRLSIARHNYLPIGGLMFFVIWLALSYQSNQLFFNEIMISGFVVNALLFMRAFDNYSDQRDQ